MKDECANNQNGATGSPKYRVEFKLNSVPYDSYGDVAGGTGIEMTTKVNIMGSFPDVITVKIIDSETDQPIPNIAVQITLFATHKNDYELIPSLCNVYGIIKIDKIWLNEEVEKNRNIFIMDYSSNLDDCQMKMEIKIMNMNEINQAVNGMKEWKSAFKIPGEEIKSLSRASNGYYESISQVVNFNGRNLVDIELKTKKYK